MLRPAAQFSHLGRGAKIALLALIVAACAERSARSVQNMPGNPEAGRQAIAEIACGVCHVIPGVAGARGQVGPNLDGFAQRAYIAGNVPNEYDNLLRWVLDPPSLAPATAMPRMPITEEQAQHIVAYLYTLK